MDRTNWKWGKLSLNILMLSIVTPYITFPLMWATLQKEGKGITFNSHTSERIALMQRFLNLFPASHCGILLADREFASEEFCNWLDKQGLIYQIRIVCTLIIEEQQEGKCTVEWFFRNTYGQVLDLGWRKILGKKRYITGTRLTDTNYLVVISNRETPLDVYRSRWGIETLFSGFKTRGFHLEDTHITDPVRLSRLVALLSIAYTFAGSYGVWTLQERSLRALKHERPAVSALRIGLDLLQQHVVHLCRTVKESQGAILMQFLSCT
jgi:hypothetical protein